ncbi:hypothetical protein [Paraburkholderia aromaticivorans]
MLEEQCPHRRAPLALGDDTGSACVASSIYRDLHYSGFLSPQMGLWNSRS